MNYACFPLAGELCSDCHSTETGCVLHTRAYLRAYKVPICDHGLKGGTFLAESSWDTLPLCEVLRNLANSLQTVTYDLILTVS